MTFRRRRSNPPTFFFILAGIWIIWHEHDERQKTQIPTKNEEEKNIFFGLEFYNPVSRKCPYRTKRWNWLCLCRFKTWVCVCASLWMANNVIPFKNTRKRQLVHKKIVWTHCKPVPIFFRYMLVASRFISRSVGSSQLRGNLILERDWVAIQILFAPMNKERNKRLLILIVHTDQSNVTFFPNRKVPQIYKSKRQLRVSVYTVGSKTCLPTHT